MTKDLGKIWDENDTAVDPTGKNTTGGLVEEDPKGTYLILGVPNFDVDGNKGSTAYLRLGAAAAKAGDPAVWTAPSATGEDLASLVQGFADDTRDRDGTAPAGSRAPALTTVDGVAGKGLAESAPIDAAGRRDRSRKLHTLGGWRDHSDGNRISTTRGDKVEVVGGNYKMVVLGRQSTKDLGTNRKAIVGRAAGMDMSGGLEDDDSLDLRARMDRVSASADDGKPGIELKVEYSWQQDSHGDWAWTQVTTIGSATPDGSNSNHRIVNKTWVDYMKTDLGSEARPVDRVFDSTYATSIATYTDVATSCSSEVRADVVSNWTAAASINDIQNCLLSVDTRLVALGAEVDAGDIIAQAQIAGVICNNWVGLVIDDHIGLHSDVHLGAHQEIRVGMHDDTHVLHHFETHMGPHIDLHSGAHLDLHFEHMWMDLLKLDLGDGVIKLNDQECGTYGKTLKMTQFQSLGSAAQQALTMAGFHFDS